MGTALRYCLSFVILLSIANGQPMKQSFCQMNETVSRAFIIQNYIYFGDQNSFWKMNVNDFQISDKQVIGKLFGENINLKIITTAVQFGDISCDANCDQIKKARNMVLLVGNMDSTGRVDMSGYKAYKADPNMEPTAIERNDSMPWGLFTESLLREFEFWIQNIDSYEGMTFDESTKKIFMAATKNGKNAIHFRTLTENGVFEKDFKSFDSKRTYSGLIDWNGNIYGLADNKLFLLRFENELSENEEFSSKQFFNCDNNSPLKETNTTVTTVTTVTNSSSEQGSQSSQERPGTQEPQETVTPFVTPESKPSTTPKEESNSMWIILIIIIVIIVVLIILLICFVFICKKSGEKPVTREVEKSKPDSKIVSEGGSITSRTSRTGASSGRSGGLAKLSSKSEIESIASVRSKEDL